MSLEILFMILPSGVVSKNAMGALSKRPRMLEWRMREAETQPMATPNELMNNVMTGNSVHEQYYNE